MFLIGGSGKQWKKFWRDENVTVLVNQNVTIYPEGIGCGPNEGFNLIGLEDLENGGSVKNSTNAWVLNHPSMPSIVVAHQPKAAFEASELGVDLQLSGHVHAGQVFPLQILDYFGNKGLFAGATKVLEMKLYISEGVIGWGPRTRIFSRNERTVLTLRPESTIISREKLRKQEDLLDYNVGIWLSGMTIILQFAGCFGLLLTRPGRKLFRFVFKRGNRVQERETQIVV